MAYEIALSLDAVMYSAVIPSYLQTLKGTLLSLVSRFRFSNTKILETEAQIQVNTIVSKNPRLKRDLFWASRKARSLFRQIAGSSSVTLVKLDRFQNFWQITFCRFFHSYCLRLDTNLFPVPADLSYQTIPSKYRVHN